MTINMNCIICGTHTGRATLYGSINGMKVTFCNRHINNCVNCDSCTYKLALKGRPNRPAKEIAAN